jgi:hypothetical protein
MIKTDIYLPERVVSHGKKLELGWQISADEAGGSLVFSFN